MSQEDLLRKIHGKVCAIDDRTEHHQDLLDKIADSLSNLRERTAVVESETKNLKESAARAGRNRGATWGAGAGALIAAAAAAFKHFFGMEG